jgi:HSP20 family protein
MATEMSRWSPGRELAGLQDEVSRMFSQVFGADTPVTSAGAWSPALDVEETDAEFILHVELPGMSPDDVEIAIEESVLTVTGERRFYDDRNEEGFRRVERRYGRFHRAVRLPDRVKPDEIDASYRDGLVTITVPKAPEARPRRIKVTHA